MSASPVNSRGVATRRPDEPNLIEPGRIFRLVAEHWLPALALALIFAGLTCYVLLRQPRIYASSATLLVERSNDRVVDIKQVVDDTVESSLTDALMLTHIQQIQSHSFLTQVVASLTPAQRIRCLAPYPLAPGDSGFGVQEEPESQTDRLEKVISKGLKVDRSGHTLLITLTVRHRDPAMAQLLANSLAAQYIVYLINRSSASNDSALTFLNRQAVELRDQLEAAEHALQKYREQNNLVLLDHDQTILSDRLKSMSTAATQARMARQSLEARLAQVKSVLQKSDEGVRQLARAPEFAGLADVQKQIDELQARRNIMADRYGPMHPLMLENAASVRAFENLRAGQIASALAEFGAQRDSALADEKRIGDELAAAQAESLRLDKLAVRDNELGREVATVRDSYTQILGRLNQTTISSRLQNTNIKFVDRAALPDVPVEPNRLRVLFLAGVIGVIIFSVYPVAADASDKRIRSWSEIEGYLAVPLLAELPRVTKTAAKKRGQIVAHDLDIQTAEAFRSLHGQLQIFSKAPFPKTVLVTSTAPAEGKSFVACNLSASFAAHGRRTLLIDGDFRRPALHTAFGLDNEKGILTWDRQNLAVDAAAMELNPTLGIAEVAPNLHLLRSGGVSRKMTELLECGALSELLAALQRQFEMIVIDTPPAGIFPDAEILARLTSEVVYVCRFKGPKRLHVRQVLDRLAKAGVNLSGIVLNGIPVRRLGPNYFSEQGYSSIRHAKYYALKT